VGRDEKQKDFAVHTDLLRSRSPFFKASLSVSWAEPGDNMVPLPGDDPKTFQLYCKWLYYGELSSRSDVDLHDMFEEWDNLLRSFVLADKILDSVFEDRIVDAILENAQATAYGGRSHQLGYQAPKIIYTVAQVDAPARRMLIDIAVHCWTDGDSKLACNWHVAQYPEFVEDLSFALAKLRGGGRSVVPWEGDTCRYHRHVSLNKPCYTK